jgi:hypothetical protein
MPIKSHRLGLIFLLCCSSALANPADADKSKQIQLAGQKVKLVESLLATPAMKSAPDSRNPEVAAWAINSRILLDQALAALAVEDAAKAIEKLDEALRSMSRSSSMLTKDESNIQEQKRQFDEYAKQIDGYRRSLLDITAPPNSANASRQLVTRLDSMTSQANKLQENGRIADATKRMADAYKLAVEEITKMRDGQEVVMKLSFASPREEFLYEQKRFHSSEIMLSMMLKEKQSTPDSMTQIQTHAANADSLKVEANAKAGANDYSGAVKDMEKAIQQLNRALQILGLPVF